jgi:hypothetical protein
LTTPLSAFASMVVVNDLNDGWLGQAERKCVLCAGCWKVGVWKRRKLRNKTNKMNKRLVIGGSWCSGRGVAV